MNEQEYVIETTYKIKYTTKEPVSIPDIIKSLESTESLLRRTPAFIEKAYDGISVSHFDVYVETLSTGSLLTDFIVKFVVKERNAEKFKEAWEGMMADNDTLKMVVAVGVGALATYGVMKTQPASAPTSHIEAYEHSTVHVGNKVGLSGDEIIEILDKVSDKKTLAKEAIEFIKPARKDGSATIEMAEIPDLTIPHNFIDEAPEEYTPPTPEEKTESFSNVDVIVYASDREKIDQIWAGLIPGAVDKRTKFILDEGIDPKQLHGRTKFKADVEILSHYVKSRKLYEPKEVLIKTVRQ